MNQIEQSHGAQTESEQKVDYEKENLKLDQKKFNHDIEKDRLEQRFSRKHLWPFATAIISIAAAVIAGAQAYIAYNNITSNSQSGIYLWSSSNNSITNNNVTDNFYSIFLHTSNYNGLTNNTLTENC